MLLLIIIEEFIKKNQLNIFNAVETFENIITLNPIHISTYNQIAYCHLSICDYKEVFKICQRAINLNINDNDLNLFFINCNIGLREYSKLIGLIENYIQENLNDQSYKNLNST